MRNLVIITLVSLCIIGLTGCGRPLSRGEKGALIGSGAGALIGGIAGGGTGAAIGAVGGAMVGGVIGHSTDRKRARCKRYNKHKKCIQY